MERYGSFRTAASTRVRGFYQVSWLRRMLYADAKIDEFDLRFLWGLNERPIECTMQVTELTCWLLGHKNMRPSKVADGRARLQALDLFIEIREVQALQAGSLSVFISEFTASAREHQKGITISCVGRAVDMPSAVGDAVVQWSLGVLPVLAQWRGKHSCFSASGQVETQVGPFDLLAGPVIARGHSEGASLPAIGGVSLSKSLLPALRNQRLAQRLHWLELFDCKFDDGSVEATCRLDNRDWLAGTKVLSDVAPAWPTTKEPIQSCRQFVMLLPKNGDTQQIIVPTLWSRLFGRA